MTAQLHILGDPSCRSLCEIDVPEDVVFLDRVKSEVNKFVCDCNRYWRGGDNHNPRTVSQRRLHRCTLSLRLPHRRTTLSHVRMSRTVRRRKYRSSGVCRCFPMRGKLCYRARQFYVSLKLKTGWNRLPECLKLEVVLDYRLHFKEKSFRLLVIVVIMLWLNTVHLQLVPVWQWTQVTIKTSVRPIWLTYGCAYHRHKHANECHATQG